VSGVKVRDKNGKAADLIKIVSQDYRWALGKVDEVEGFGPSDSLYNRLKEERISKYLENLDAIIGVAVFFVGLKSRARLALLSYGVLRPNGRVS
jgi:hypothetical protein